MFSLRYFCGEKKKNSSLWYNFQNFILSLSCRPEKRATDIEESYNNIVRLGGNGITEDEIKKSFKL
jgi:hypothetical protein